MTDTSRARTLVLLRHAKAQGSAATDHERELSARGRADAAAVGRWLVTAGHSFDSVVSSTSTRTRETWNEIRAAGVTAAEVHFEDRVYAGDADLLLEVLVQVPDSVFSVLVVGHAPTIPDLARFLADPGSNDPDAVDDLRSSFPTGALAVLTLDGSWAGLAAGGATLTVMATPRA